MPAVTAEQQRVAVELGRRARRGRHAGEQQRRVIAGDAQRALLDALLGQKRRQLRTQLSQLLLAIPLCVLYELGIFLARFVVKPKDADEAAAPEAP